MVRAFFIVVPFGLLVENLSRLSRGSDSRPLAKPVQAYPGKPVPALSPRISVRPRIQPELARLVSDAIAVVGWHRLNHRLTPGVRAHYSFKSCQLVTTWHQLIRGKVIFKEPSVVTADPLTLRRFFCGMGVLYR